MNLPPSDEMQGNCYQNEKRESNSLLTFNLVAKVSCHSRSNKIIGSGVLPLSQQMLEQLNARKWLLTHFLAMRFISDYFLGFFGFDEPATLSTFFCAIFLYIQLTYSLHGQIKHTVMPSQHQSECPLSQVLNMSEPYLLPKSLVDKPSTQQQIPIKSLKNRFMSSIKSNDNSHRKITETCGNNLKYSLIETQSVSISRETTAVTMAGTCHRKKHSHTSSYFKSLLLKMSSASHTRFSSSSSSSDLKHASNHPPFCTHQNVSLTSKPFNDNANIEEESIATNRTFNNFEFSDITCESRGMFIDLSYTHGFKLRGQSYNLDHRKVDPGPAMCKLMLMELYRVDTAKDGERHDHVVSRGLAQKRLQAIRSLTGNPFVFVVNFQMPGDPPFSMVCYFALPSDLRERFPGPETESFLKLFREFARLPATEEERLKLWGRTPPGDTTDVSSASSEGSANDEIRPTHLIHPVIAAPVAVGCGFWGVKLPSDITWPDGSGPGAYPQSDFRNMRLKVIPMVSEAPWVVRAAMPAKPTMIARKVAHRYFAGEGYIETDVEVGSSYTAARIVGVCRGASKYCAVDVGIVLQGETPEELPERLIGAFTVNHVDTTMLRSLDE